MNIIRKGSLPKPNYTPDYQYTKLSGGINMSHVELGEQDGYPVVLLHGVTDSYISFSQVGMVLASLGYHVYIPEFRGHGHSDKPQEEITVEQLARDIQEWMKIRQINQVHLAGHSLGSIVAQQLALTWPESAVSMTLIGTTSSIDENQTLTWLLEGDETFPGVRKAGDSLPERFLKDWSYSDNFDPEFVEHTYNHVVTVPVHTWKSALNNLQFNTTSQLGQLTIPVQVIWGTNDDFFSYAEQIALIEALGSDTIIFRKKQGAGHNTHWEKQLGLEVGNDIDAFIKLADISRNR